MTDYDRLVQFFYQLQAELLKNPVDDGLEKTLAMFANNLAMQAKMKKPAPYAKHYWSTIVTSTKGMGFWDRWKGDAELKEMLREFLGG